MEFKSATTCKIVSLASFYGLPTNTGSVEQCFKIESDFEQKKLSIYGLLV